MSLYKNAFKHAIILTCCATASTAFAAAWTIDMSKVSPVVTPLMWLGAAIYVITKLIDLFKGDGGIGSVFGMAGVIAVAYWWKAVIEAFITNT